MELCDASLDKVFLPDNDPKKYRGLLPSNEQALLQLAQGLDYIHSKQLIHRDITPQNVLIASSKLPVTMKWSIFGLSKLVNSNEEHCVREFRGTRRDWMAPEVLALAENESDSANIRGTMASDVFVAGCLFFFYLTGGRHPFGRGVDIRRNIYKGKCVNLNSKWLIK